MDSTYLKYGDIVLFYSESGPGYLQSQGFTNGKCFIQHQPKELKQSCRNFRDYIFRIEPKMTYDAKSQYLEFLKIKEKSQNNAASELQLNDENSEIEIKLKIFEKKMMEEEESNRKLSARKEGEWVTYGNEIQLMHYDSKGFVSALKVVADFDRSCNRVEIADQPSSSVYFKILPRYKFRQEGEKILFRDQIVLLNMRTNLYMHITERWIEINEKINLPKEDWRPLDADRRDNPADFCKRYEVNCSTSISTFKPIPHAQVGEDPSNKFIKGSQIVRLQHTELGGYLTSDDLDFTDDQLAEVYVRAYNGDRFDMEATTSGDLFEVEIAHNSDRGQICSFNEEIETTTQFYYRLRHLNSGRLVRPQQVTLSGKKINTLGLADHIDDKNIKELMESSLFKLFSTTVDNDNRIRSGETTKIFSIKTKEYICTKEDQEWTGGVQGGGGRAQSRAQSRGFQRPKTKGGYDDFIEDPDDVKHEETKGTAGKRNKGKSNEIYRPIDDDEFYNSRNLVIELNPKAANEDAFLISIVNENEVKDLLFVQTVGTQLYTFTKYLRSKKFNEITQDMYSKIIENLSKLIFFVTKTESTDPIRCEGIPIKSRQKLMRELRIIELLVDCLYYPFSSGAFKIKELTNDMPIKMICTLCYRLILHSVKNYKNNELYASQWIDLYFDHSMTSSETNLKAEATIAVLISSNKTLLEKQITRQTIEKFINLSKEQDKDERFITLLGALCSCMEEAIPNNQNNVIELMFENQINKDALNVPIRENGDNVELEFDEANEKVWINIRDLKEFSNAKQGKSNLYKYYLAFVDLVSETCLDRNRKALNNLCDIYKLSILFKVITNRRLEYPIRSRFVKLMYNMYINKDPYGEIKVPNLTRIWDEISAVGNKIFFYKEELPQYMNDLKMYILYYLKDIKGVMSIFENDKNRMSLQVVKLVRCMVSFGFYKTKDELREISMALIAMLNGTTDIYELLQEKLVRENRMESLIRNLNENNSTQNNQRYEKNEDNLVIMKCKQYICETLLKILDLEYDLKISLFLGFLKEEVESYQPINPSPQDAEYQVHGATSKVFPQDSMRKRNQYANDEESGNRLLYVPQSKENVSFEDNSVVIWIEKVLMGEQLFDGYPQTTYVCVLMDLIAYQHLPLSNRAFELLTRLFTQRASLINLLKQIQLLEHPESIQTLNRCNEILKELRKFIDTIDFWLNDDSTKLNSSDIATGLVSSRESVDYLCHILTDRVQIRKSISLKSSTDTHQNYEIIHGFKNNVGDPVVVDFEGNVLRKSEYFNDSVIANNENQRLLRNLGAHEIIIEILKYNLSQKKTHSDYEDIIRSAYIFLIRFCKDNAVNQGLVGEYLDIFVKEINTNPLSIFLIKEIFKDNKIFLSTRGQKIVKYIVKKEETIPINMPEKYHYIDTLQTFAKCKSRIVKRNQNEILINMASEEEGSICSLLNSKSGISKVKSFVEKISKAKHDTKGGVAEIDFPIELYNLISFLDLVCVCCEGKNEFAELKAQTSICKIGDILELLQFSDQFIPFKISLVMYLYHAWLIVGKNEVFSEEENEEVLWKIIEILVSDLEAKNNEDSNDDSKIIYGPPYNKSLKQVSDIYVYTAVINALGSVIKLSLNFEGKEDLISKLISTTCKLYDKAEFDEFKKPAFDLISYAYSSTSYTRYLDDINHPILTGNEPNSDADEDPEIVKTVSRGKSTIKRGSLAIGLGERTKASIFAQKINSITKYEEMEELLEKEFEGMVKWFAEFSELCDPEFQGFDPITHLFNLLDPENTSLSVELQIYGLKVIRKIVETCNDQMVTPAADWDNDDWEHCMAKIDIRQDYLVTKGCIHFLCKYISKCENVEAFDEAILACIALCLGGNFESQEEFLNYMMTDDSNLFLLKIRDMIARKFEVVKILVNEKSVQLLQKYAMEEEGDFAGKINMTTFTGAGDYILTTEDEDDIEDIEDENEINSETETVESAVININRIFRFLQLLCENHFLGNQDYLREQKVDDVINPKSFDFVAYISNLFGIFIKGYVNCYSSDIGDLLMSLLTELIQGPCKGNQTTEINNKVIENCTELIFSYSSTKLLKQKGFVGDKAIELDELKQHCVTLLLSLIEGKCDDFLKKSMIQAIDNFYIVFQRMHEIYEKFVDEELGLNPKTASLSQVTNHLKNDSFDCFIQEGFELYILIKLLMDDKDPEALRRYKEYEQQLPAEDDPDSMHRSIKFYKKFIGSCEVIVKGDLFRVYFPIPPVCRFLTPQVKDDFLSNVDRDSPQLKIAGFIEAMPDLIDNMEHTERLNRGLIKITQETVLKIRNLAYLVALTINIIILSHYEITSSSDGTNPYYIRADSDNYKYKDAVYWLGVVQIIVNGLLILVWLYTNFSLEIKRYWREYNDSCMAYYYADKPVTNVYESSGSGDMGSGRVFTKPARELTLREARRTLKFFGIEAPEFNMNGKRDYGHFIVRLEYYWLSMVFILKNGSLLYYLVMLLFACAGFKLSIMFYSLMLLDIVGRLPVLQDVIRSVTLNYKELLLTALLGVIIIYIYSTLYFTYFQDHYYDANVDIAIKARNGNLICFNLYHCFLSTLGYGLRGGGGIADSLKPISSNSVNVFYLRYVIDMSFFVIIVTVLLNIVFGIIIDTFAELREGKAAFEQDKNNICFICGIERFQFDRYGEGFEKHIENDHSIFNYLYYKIYIKGKPVTEYNGTESNIGEDSTWFPFNKALILEKSNEGEEGEEKDSLETYVKELEEQVVLLEAKANEL